MAKYVNPTFGMANRSMLTVPVVPSTGAAGFKALRSTQAKAVRAASIPTSVGSSVLPNGKKAKKVT